MLRTGYYGYSRCSKAETARQARNGLAPPLEGVLLTICLRFRFKTGVKTAKITSNQTQKTT